MQFNKLILSTLLIAANLAAPIAANAGAAPAAASAVRSEVSVSSVATTDAGLSALIKGAGIQAEFAREAENKELNEYVKKNPSKLKDVATFIAQYLKAEKNGAFAASGKFSGAVAKPEISKLSVEYASADDALMLQDFVNMYTKFNLKMQSSPNQNPRATFLGLRRSMLKAREARKGVTDEQKQKANAIEIETKLDGQPCGA